MLAVLLPKAAEAVRYFNVTVVSVDNATRKLLFIMVDIELFDHDGRCTIGIEEGGALYMN